MSASGPSSPGEGPTPENELPNNILADINGTPISIHKCVTMILYRRVTKADRSKMLHVLERHAFPSTGRHYSDY